LAANSALAGNRDQHPLAARAFRDLPIALMSRIPYHPPVLHNLPHRPQSQSGKGFPGYNKVPSQPVRQGRNPQLYERQSQCV
jgi:hypothetical protein